MYPARVHFIKTLCTVVGAFLLVTSACFVWYWGNVLIYVLSYILKHTDEGSLIDTPWTISLYIVFNNLGFIATGCLTRVIHMRKVAFCGVLLSSCATMSTYYSIQSYTTLNITMGVFLGFGHGVVNASALHYVGDWTFGHSGLIIGIVQTATSIGGFFQNAFVTLFANPKRLTPDVKIGEYKLFSQPDVTENVPHMFLILGASSFVISMVGVAMVRDAEPRCEKGGETNGYGALKDMKQGEGKSGDGDREETGNSTSIEKEDKTLGKYSQEETRDDLAVAEQDEATRKETHAQGEKKDYTPKEMMKTKAFYVMICLLMASETAILIFIGHYKVYGELWIKDDYTLTLAGNMMNVSAVCGRIISGRLADWIGIKNCIVVVYSWLPIVCLFFYFSPMVNTGAYILAVINCAFFSGIYSTIGAATLKLFGGTHFAINLGLVTTPSVAIQLVIPMLIKTSLVHFGWFSLFVYCAMPCAVGLILAILYLPN